MPDFESRSNEVEIIDDFDLAGPELIGSLRSIERVNRWLGGNRVLVDSLAELAKDLRPRPSPSPLVVWDLGCGSGDGLRAMAEWGRESGTPLRLVGIDANPAVIEFAKDQSRTLPEITWRCADILSPAFWADPDPTQRRKDEGTRVDVITFNLCLHHFSDDEIVDLLRRCRVAGAGAVLINDLHRSAWAYYLFWMFCVVFRAPHIARVDGLLSVRKGFRRSELAALVSTVGSRHRIRWRWAFRYQALVFLDRG